MRHDYCEKDGIYIKCTDNDVCFEDVNTAETVLVLNDGMLAINNFDKKRTETIMKIYWKIYKTIVYFRTLDRFVIARSEATKN